MSLSPQENARQWTDIKFETLLVEVRDLRTIVETSLDAVILIERRVGDLRQRLSNERDA